MAATEWYYTRGSKQFGPVPASELKQLADHGELGPEELVWREGMDQWIPARRVKGLFGQEGPPLATKEEPAASPGSAEGGAAAEPVKGAEPLTPAAPPASQPAQPGAARATFESSASAFERAQAGGSRHLFDLFLDSLRPAFNAEFVRATAALFQVSGHYLLYAAMVLFLGVEMVRGVQAKSLWAVLLGFGGVAVLAVLQYAAGRIPAALERLDRATVSRMPSPVFLDCLALLGFLAGLADLVGWTVYAVQTQDFGWILPAVMTFILFQYIAVAALNPESLHLAVSSDATAGEEAIGILSFLVKLGLRTVPVVFGIGVLWGVLLLGFAAYLVAAPSVGENVTMNFGPDVLSEWLSQGLMLPPAQVVAIVAGTVIAVSAAFPLIAYLGFLFCQLGIEFLRAVLAIPGSADHLAESKKTGELL